MSETSPLRVAFCGLGRMGTQMATRVAAGGFPLAVWNRSPEAARSLADATGATAAATPREAAQDADVVITMLTDGPAVLSVLDGPDGVLAGLRAGGVVVDCSTTGAELAGEAAELCARARVSFLDCPVSGSTVVAGRGELGLMVGGDVADLDRVRSVLATFGRTVVHVGPTGAGAAAKIAVNGLLHTFSTTLAESLVAAEAAGVARTALFDVLAAGVLSNTFLDYKRDAFVDPERSGVAFDLATASKDLSLALDASRAAGLGPTVVGRVLELHREAVADGFGDKDMAAMTTWLREKAGATPEAPTADLHQTLERT